jgi:O-antigen/teichoic acid export membrane protein
MATPARGMAPTAMSNAIATSAVRLSTVAVGMILTPFLLNRIGPVRYGVLVAAGSAYEYLSLLRGGMGGALRRYVTVHHHAARHEEARRYYAAGFWWAALLRLATFAVGLALAVPLSQFLRIPPDMLRDCAIGVSLIFFAAVVLDAAILLEVPTYATGRTALLSVAWGLLKWLRLGFTVLAFQVLAPGLAVYGGAAVGTEMVSLMVMAWLAQRSRVVGSAIPRPEFGSPVVRRELFRYGGLALLSQVAMLLYLGADNLLIGRFFGAGAVTHYSLGTRWYPLVFGFVVTAISSLTPLFTRLDARGELERSRDALRQVAAVASAIAVPACLVPCVIGDLFLVAWVGPTYRGSAQYLIAMMVPLTLEVAMAPVWMALTARGRIGLVAVGSLFVAVGNVGLSLLLALGFHMGLLGFALGNTVALLAKNGLLPLALRRHPDPGVPPMGGVLKPFPRAILGGLPGLALLYLMRPACAGHLGMIIVAGMIGGVLCLAGSSFAALGLPGLRRLMGILARTASRAGDASAAPAPARPGGGAPEDGTPIE